MSISGAVTEQPGLQRWLMPVSSSAWFGIFTSLWKVGGQIFHNLANEGIYEVLDYESTLELLNRSGTKAIFKKCKRIRYLQNEVITYQDHAWGDGEILINYRTNRGKPVDWYRSGYKTYILLSLRDVKGCRRGSLFR
jgi:hypothetical protein